MQPILDHIAIVTGSLSATVAQFPATFLRHDIEIFQSEGTKEQYLTLPNRESPSILVIEPIADGPYARALAKRGSGLHHLGCTTDNLDLAINHLAACGLLLHPISLKTIAKQVVWLCRPGLPFLLELDHRPDAEPPQFTQTVLELPQPILYKHADELIAACSIRTAPDNRLHIAIGDVAFELVLDE